MPVPEFTMDPSMRRQFSERTPQRILDILAAILALALLWPIMTLIAVAIFVESGRPILFVQPRLGQYGRIFQVLKFRKFHPDCSSNGPPLTFEADARLTRVGKILMLTKLDELPQLFNVLAGDMSVVGPRPESLAFADCFAGGFEAVLDYKPGIVGPSQAAFRSEADFLPRDGSATEFYRDVLFPLKGLVDLKYYANRTIVSDVVWIAASLLMVCGWVLPIVPFQKYRKTSRTAKRLGNRAAV